MTDTKKECPVCKGERGSYEPCGEDYSMMWLECQECEGAGEVDDEPQRHGECVDQEKAK